MKILKVLVVSLGIFFLGLLIFLLAAFFIVKDLKVKEIVEDEIEQTLGIRVTIERLQFSPLMSHIEAEGITIHNPSGFREGELASISSIHFVIDPLEIMIRQKPNIYLFAMDLTSLNIIKNKEGKVNIEEIFPLNGKNAEPDDTPFYFGVVVLNVGEVTYTDETGRGQKTRRYPIGLKNATFVGLKDEQDVVRLVVRKAIENTDIGKLIHLTIVPVVSHVTDTLDAAWGTAKTGAKSVWAITTMPFKLLFHKG